MNLDGTEARIGDRRSTDRIDNALASYLKAGRETVASADIGNPLRAESLREGGFEESYDNLASLLENRQTALTETIEASDDISDRSRGSRSSQ